MNIHEYQAKALLAAHDAPVPQGKVAFSPEDAARAAEDIPGPPWVLKAQIHAGGRGKAGGVRIVDSAEELRARAAQMLGMTLITPQTGPQGRQVRRLYVEEASKVDREFYLSLLVDRTTSRVTFVASTAGGMDIEQVAATMPGKIFTQHVDPACGFCAFHGRRLAAALGLHADLARQAAALARTLYEVFTRNDLSLLEINPLVATQDAALVCLDAKIAVDDNALFRHPGLRELRDPDEEDPAEAEAADHGLSYIKLDGNIGCMVNGAGLAMATMDIIQLHGAQPANFLDVGGGANREKVTQAFKLILADPSVKGILINIFGGIMRCDVIAEGVVAAAREIGLRVPLVVRLAGANAEQGRRVLQDSGLPLIAADTLDDAARRIAAAVGEQAAPPRPVRKKTA